MVGGLLPRRPPGLADALAAPGRQPAKLVVGRRLDRGCAFRVVPIRCHAHSGFFASDGSRHAALSVSLALSSALLGRLQPKFVNRALRPTRHSHSILTIIMPIQEAAEKLIW